MWGHKEGTAAAAPLSYLPSQRGTGWIPSHMASGQRDKIMSGWHHTEVTHQGLYEH